MCGILCAIGKNTNVNCCLHSALASLLQNRGPNANGKQLEDDILLAGYVLWQQGSAAPQNQPIIEGDGSLLFNGDLFNVDTRKSPYRSDSAWLAKQLAQCASDEEILLLLQQLEGPHCLLFYNKHRRTLYFARDALGRNSLVIERHKDGLLLLSSTSYFLPDQNAISLELPPLGLYKLHLDDLSSCILYPWRSQLNDYLYEQLNKLEIAMQWKTLVSAAIAPDWLLTSSQDIAAYDFYEHCCGENCEELFAKLIDLPAVLQTLDTFDVLIRKSVAERVTHTAPFCRICLKEPQLPANCEHAKLCLLYSGGIDCSILALLADKFVPKEQPIELINVAFERSVAATVDWNVPDRQTATQSLAELQHLCPSRRWHLIEVNVTREKLQQQLSTHIKHLIYPLQTVLDESIGCAFWFAAASAQSSARVALLGSGADELFGGYIRHRNAYRRCGGDAEARQLAVFKELEMDWQRIPSRNLARDDRVIADTGKTARAPFIEEHLVRFVRSLRPQQRCCFNLPEGVGDKLLLRLYGYRLGLREASLLKKRAIQFGSRIADKKQQAQQMSHHLQFQAINMDQYISVTAPMLDSILSSWSFNTIEAALY